MLRAFFVPAALAACLFATLGSSPVSAAPSGAEASADTLAAAKPGMMIMDAAGKRVGRVVKVTRDAHGQTSLVVTIDGNPVILGANALSMNPAGNGLVSSMTRDQIKAATGSTAG